MWTAILDVLLAVLSLSAILWLWSSRRAVKSFLDGYGAEKGKNLATHEDLNKLVEQLRAVTKATEEIKAKISDEVWNRQKQWEMKREVLFAAAKALATIDDALLSLGSVFALEDSPETLALAEAKAEESRKWLEATARFDEARLLVAIVCRRETKEAFDQMALKMSAMSQNVTKGERDNYLAGRKELALKFFGVRDAMRKELDLEND